MLDPERERRLAQLEEDRRKLMDVIEEKQRAKRAGLRDWERIEREGRREALKSELAEGHLEKLGGEVGGAGGRIESRTVAPFLCACWFDLVGWLVSRRLLRLLGEAWCVDDELTWVWFEWKLPRVRASREGFHRARPLDERDVWFCFSSGEPCIQRDETAYRGFHSAFPFRTIPTSED